MHKLFGDIQNPAEWSEDTIRKAIEEVGLTQHQINWFKNNVFPPKQEWSKEEKERIRQSGRLDVCYNPEKYGFCHKTEWGDGEMKALDSIIDDYELAAKSFCGHDGKIMFLKAIRDGEYGLSKQEWSEEDKVMLNNIIWGVHMKSIKPLDEMDDRSKYERYEDFLKALPERFNLQPRTEWSEEDENRFRNLIYLVEDSNEGKGTKEGFVKFINRLKSLRPNPHWKPSEYQMKALKDVIDRALLTCRQQVPLESLYNELNKLFEI